MSSIILRDANIEDANEMMQMILELAAHEECPNGPRINVSDLIRDGFETDPPQFYCIMAECEETKEIVGFLMWHYTYSSWHGQGIYMENIYVRAQHRRKKIGHRLLKEICLIAKKKGVKKIDWNVLAKNHQAVKFYDSHEGYNVFRVEGRSTYRLFDDKIGKIANSLEQHENFRG